MGLFHFLHFQYCILIKTLFLSYIFGQMEEFANFDFNLWRKRYIQWISHLKSRILDVFRSIDRDQDGRITRKEFVNYVLASSKFPLPIPGSLITSTNSVKSFCTSFVPLFCRVSYKRTRNECCGKYL